MTSTASTATTTTSPKPAWGAIWSIAIVIAALSASELLPASLLTPMASSLNVSEGLIGQSVTATAILAVATSLLVAPLSRRYNRRPLLLIFGGALIASNLVVAIAPNATIMLSARLVLGITLGGVWGLAASLALRLVPSTSVPRALSIIFGGSTVAAIAAAPLGALFGDVVGWRAVFAGVAVVCAAAVAFQYFVLPSMAPLGGSRKVEVKAVLLLPGLIPGMAAVLLFWGGAYSFNTYIRPYLEGVSGVNSSELSVVLLCFGVASFVGTLLAAPLMQWNLRLVLPITAAAQAVLLLALLLLGQSWIAAAALIASWGLFVGMAGVGWSTWVARSYPEHAESTGGLLVAAIQVAMMSGALFGGALIDGINPAAPLLAATIILAGAAFYTGLIMRPHRKDPKHS
ncbi:MULTISPECIES: MFS transporter [unclassified Arthrobacter]|uniref:MFS transporter n=1 Tax=unclassified Arthrobacter TaxID=235627 RepID=UPI0028831113|nr:MULTISPECIES: MFS transporter [unclassified Arthrobacter]